MKKKTPAPTTEATPSSVDPHHLALYVILDDGTPAKRLRPLTIGERTYYNLPIGPEGKPRRVAAEKLHEHIVARA